MCIKTGCTVKAHKDNMWIFNTRSVSNSDQHVSIRVKSKEDTMVWTATMLAHEVVKSDGERLQHEKRPLSQWKSVFDRVRASDGSAHILQLSMQEATDAATDIREKVRTTPLKRANSKLSLPTTQGMKGDNLLD